MSRLFGLRNRRRRRGALMVVVLMAVAMLAVGGYSFAEWMFVEQKAVRVQGNELAARQLALSGVEYAKSVLDRPKRASESATPSAAYDPWRAQVVTLTSPLGPGRFSLVAPTDPENPAPEIRFGLGDESARLNLRAVWEWEQARPGQGRLALLNLPGMTDEAIDALFDWIDADDEPRPLGAESQYYLSLPEPYAPRNGLPLALDELCYVRGITPALLYGADANRNGEIEPVEFTRAEKRRARMTSDSGSFGWSGLLTLDSAEGERNAHGAAKIDINQANLRELERQLQRVMEERYAEFIIAYRQYGPAPPPPAGAPPKPASAAKPPRPTIDLNAPPRFRINSLLDLIGVQVALPARPGVPLSPPLDSPWPRERQRLRETLPKLWDAVGCGPARRVGRVNVNLAPRAVLAAVPGMSEPVLEAIVGNRARGEDSMAPPRRDLLWLFFEGHLELDQLRVLEPYLTGGGDVYRAQVVGYFEQQGPIVRAEIVLDATTPRSRLLCWNELSPLGRGYDLEVLGVGPSYLGR